jgi:transcriptional regulator
MYVPPHFRLDDPALQLELMRKHPFATVIGTVDGALEIAHIPLLVDLRQGRFVIHGHVARRNRLHEARVATAVFHGPHAYISARWYRQPDMVPTWHYLTVHAHGDLTPIGDPVEQRGLFDRLGVAFEPDTARLWWQDLGETTYEAFRNAIMWFRLDVTTIVGKAKLGQDDAADGRAHVIEALRATGERDDTAIADAMMRGPHTR